MAEELYKVVFKGEIGFDYDEAEVKANLQQKCGFDTATVDKLFSGGSFVLKKNIDAALANRYRESLQRMGAHCEVLPMVPPPAYVPEAPPAPPALSETPAVLRKPDFRCPACGEAQEKSESCGSCGVYFAKFERHKARLAAQEQAPEPAVAEKRLPSAGKPGGAARTARDDRGEGQRFPLYAGAVILAMVLLQSLLGRDLMVLGAILLPFAFLVFLMVRALVTRNHVADLMADYFSLEADHDSVTLRGGEWYPRVTYTLIVLHIALYYGLVIHLDPAVLVEDLVFLPGNPNIWNVPLSAMVAPFLHGSGWQLWGSVCFLWAAGTVVERRLGSWRVIALYLFCAVLAGGTAALAHTLLLDAPLHGFGSSGAIAGLLGLCAGVCWSRSLIFPLPLVGAVALFSPLRLNVRLDPLLLLGLFFYANLSSVADPQHTIAAAMVGHLGHLGGFLVGLLAGMLIDPGSLAPAED